jgi:hypothetical protein
VYNTTDVGVKSVMTRSLEGVPSVRPNEMIVSGNHVPCVLSCLVLSCFFFKYVGTSLVQRLRSNGLDDHDDPSVVARVGDVDATLGPLLQRHWG